MIPLPFSFRRSAVERERAENRRDIPRWRLALAGAAVFLLSAVTASAAMVQVEGVSASRPGQEPLVPPSTPH